MDPGTYKIILVIDIREMKSKRERASVLAEMLTKRGEHIEVELRALAVGDLCWIAQSLENREHEVVLDILLERKRLSDLCESMKDGRYREQKAHTKKSAVTRIFYLIEDDSPAMRANYQLQIDTALSSMQVIDQRNHEPQGYTRLLRPASSSSP
ncbi:ERCC4 domain-containing protein [Mycena floridula]|nr:ERCC4 domain-containing protein [Mycena floridula]